MLYFISLCPEKKRDPGVGEEWAESGEAVVPWFPAPVRNVFLSLASWKFAPMAVVADTGFDPDDLAARLAAKYPGLPRELHDAYVFGMAKAAASLPVGAHVRPLITSDSVQLQVVNTAKVITLWDTQPIKATI